jgi:hypothetical protein
VDEHISEDILFWRIFPGMHLNHFKEIPKMKVLIFRYLVPELFSAVKKPRKPCRKSEIKELKLWW